jgi:hypothetical protein
MSWLRREFTVARWWSNPFQVCATMFLGLWSVLQLTAGVTPGGVFDTQIDLHAQQFVSSTNLLGALVCFTGLHMRDLETALWVEVIGYVSLIGSLCIYIGLVATSTSWYNSGYGYGLAIAFCLGSTIRSYQIFALKRAERRAHTLRDLVTRVEETEPDG